MKHEMKMKGGMGGRNKGKSAGAVGLSKKETGFSAKVGKNHKMFGKEMSPAGK
jgi:hypothetical protein